MTTLTNLTRQLVALLLVALLPLAVLAQGVGIGTATPDASAALDIRATGQGVLLPRLTQAQRLAIASPATGLLVFQTDAPAGFWYFGASGGWTFLNPAGDNLGNHTATQPVNLQGNALVGTGADIGTAVGLGVRADGGLNIGQNTAGNNFFLGYLNGHANSYNATAGEGVGNQFLGYQSGFNNTTGSYNVFSGYRSGYSNTAADDNIFLGALSGYTNTTGVDNIFLGRTCGYNNITGSYNLFAGTFAGYANTTGVRNLFLGYISGSSNTSGADNLFLGVASGQNTTTGYQNIYLGTSSGFSATTGSGNIFLGTNSGYTNTTANDNIFLGTNSGYATTTGYQNVYLGSGSGYANTTGTFNFFGGYRAGYSNSSGNTNTFVGRQAGYNNTTASSNVFFGYQAGVGTTIGGSNVFIGTNSGQTNTTGPANTALGDNAGPASTALFNTTALGNGASVSTSNTIQLGNAAVTTLRCQVALTVSSDARFKYDVRPNVPGLAFITRLRPVTYRFDTARLAAFGRTGRLRPFTSDNNAAVHTGFLAQEVAQAAQGVGYDFDGVQAPANARDHYGLGYAQFVVPLVKAVQEQQTEIEKLQAQRTAATQRADRAEAAATTDHAALLALQAQVARLLAEGAQARH